MQRKLIRRIRSVGLALALTAAVLVPATANAMYPSDGGSRAPAAGDLRSPDAREGSPSGHGVVLADLRSPDARDTAAPTARVVEIVSTPQASFSWGDAGIGAGSAFALIALAVGALGAVRHARRRDPLPA